MASYLQVENISKSYGDKVLFDNISFNINEGDKIALIAPNGSGKTSLLNVLSGKDHSDSGGSIRFLRKIATAYLEQDYAFVPERTVFDQVFHDCPELYAAVERYQGLCEGTQGPELEKAMAEMDRLDAWNYKQKIEQMLYQLQVTRTHRPMSTLSGGEVKRVALAVTLLKGAEFIILDEPTNHLDMDVIEFLEEYLSRSRTTLFMVTHDRYFLNRVCNTIFELDRGKLYVYKGNYEAFLEKREERVANQVAEVDKARNLFRRELEWMRATPCARTGKAKYRIDAFYELKDRTQYNFDDKKIRINVQSARLGKKIIHCKDVNFSYGPRPMLKDFTYNFSRYEKLGIVGGNGIGKSTFLNLLTGSLSPQSGVIDLGESISFGYYRQEGLQFDPQATVIDIVREVAETVVMADGKRAPVTTFLNWFLFPPNMHNVKVAKLSGGERRRLYLLTVLMRNPNFLILDEPTNDLDILTLNVLEEYLASFPGCLIVVSHDRYFLDKLADHLFIFTGDGRIKDYVGRCSEYRAWVKQFQAEQAKQQNKEKTDKGPDKAASKPAGSNVGKKKVSYNDKRRMEALEASVAALEAEQAALEGRLSGTGLALEDVLKASERLGELKEELDMQTLELLELYEKYE